jgi:starvation-inducible DNA-binding protein
MLATYVSRNYHWNVVGSRFNNLHKSFANQYETLDDMIDEVAERLAHSVDQPSARSPSSPSTRGSRKHPGEHPDARSMIAALLDDHELVIRQLRKDVHHHDASRRGHE